MVGCPIHYSIHGVGQRPIVLVHGFGAHQMWWHRVVPLLSDDFSVITVDLSGNGRSGRRSAYNPELHARELAAVARDVGAGPALVVGHNMGGRSSVIAAATETALFGGLVVLDTGFRIAVRQDDAQRTVRSQRMYRTYEEIRERFRLEPLNRNYRKTSSTRSPHMQFTRLPTDGRGGRILGRRHFRTLQ